MKELYKLYHNKMKERRTTRKLPLEQREIVILSLYDQIERKEIWIPYDEVRKYVFSKITKIVKSFENNFLSCMLNLKPSMPKDKKSIIRIKATVLSKRRLSTFS
ncbi:hypothetical protein D8M05_05105 [Oceanobacillus bengalensis]|uniref:Uncharacterized protein n=1 Tax=Oceanobacillus bengalensis TaxID=1435466 RepID=A0A494Z415_9BACI|nr:hypothetical protein D8M05_05105 [Oceanobacillus bengalensis]